GLLAFALGGMGLWQGGSWRAAGLFIGALAAALALLNATAWLVVRLAKGLSRWRLQASLRLRRGERGVRGYRSPFRGAHGPPLQVVWRQGLANLCRPGSQAQTVLVSVGVGVLVMLAIHLVERTILGEIGENVPNDAPTCFC